MQKIVSWLAKFVDEHELGNVTCNDAGVITERGPDTVRGPAIAYWSKKRLLEVPDAYIEVPADIVVEVLSPWDVETKVQLKVEEYLKQGVRMVWVVDPARRTVTIHRVRKLKKVLQEADILTGENVLPGFRCPVAELFS